MVAQWIVAERLIVPIKIVKVGSDERPAGPADIAAVQQQLAQTANDPNLTIVTHHAFELDWHGASGKVLTLSNEFDLINQEILDGMMINNALLNGEGPNFSNAAVGIEAMIERLETFRREMSLWIEERIYLPEAIRQGFVDKNADGEEEYIYPKVKWNSMHLRDLQQDKTFALQLYEKGILSAQTLLELFGYDPDLELERKKEDAIQLAALGQGQGGMPGEMGGGFGGMGGPPGGGMPPLPGGAEGGPPGMGGEEAPGAPIGPAAGAPPGGPALAASTSRSSLTAEIANPADYGGKVLKRKSRDKIDQERQKIYKQTEEQKAKADQQELGPAYQIRDAKGRIIFTRPERMLMKALADNKQNGLIRYPIVPQFGVKYGSQEYPIDFAIPHLKIGLEADGEAFHSSEKQIEKDNERDRKLSQMGWTILRFTEEELEDQMSSVISAIVKNIMQKEALLKRQQESLK
jgi:very-short-patch-repair endonuclease